MPGIFLLFALRSYCLVGANLSTADLSGAKLTNVSLINADLCGANFAGADLTGTHLMASDVWGAEMDITQSNLWMLGASQGEVDHLGRAFYLPEFCPL
jgi:uncharacterized protein YjbI with pentapeptide repeats